jgi:uncharacterized protein (DUF362 family)
MKINPVFSDPDAVLVSQIPLAGPASWDDFHRAAVQAMAALDIVLENEPVVIKPNITSGERIANPDSGITTHPGFVQGMIAYVQAHGARSGRVVISDDVRDSDDAAPRCWDGTGYDRVAQETGARLHCTTMRGCVRRRVPRPQVYEALPGSRMACAPNVLINVPKLKTHNLAITTLCLKNLMGLVKVTDRHYCIEAWQELPVEVRSDPRPRREWLHQETHEIWQAGLARRLIDTAQVIRPALNVIEGVVGREGTGFQRGRNRSLGLAIAGVNMVAVDSLASYLMGFDPQRLIYLRLAAEAGLGQNDVRRLRVYLAQPGDLSLCQDVSALRVDPPLRVISHIVEDDPDLVRRMQQPVDYSDNLLGI